MTANNVDWQRRTDAWVKALHESRLRKEGRSRRPHEKKDTLINKPEIKPNRSD